MKQHRQNVHYVNNLELKSMECEEVFKDGEHLSEHVASKHSNTSAENEIYPVEKAIEEGHILDNKEGDDSIVIIIIEERNPLLNDPDKCKNCVLTFYADQSKKHVCANEEDRSLKKSTRFTTEKH